MNENYKFNPFSGVLKNDIEKIIVPKFSFESINAKINKGQSVAIEFLGKQGRGKTTHLIYLHQKMKQYPIFLLDSNSKFSEIMNNTSDVVFVDSIHHLNIVERLKLFKSKRVIIYTTHWSRKMECKLIGKKNDSIKFKGIHMDVLRKIINNRLLLANENSKNTNADFTDKELYKLINQFGDNYRGIINNLYEKYQ